jgi:hypothetical protein
MCHTAPPGNIAHPGNIQGTFKEHTGNIQGTFSHSGNIQGTFREHSGNIQETLRENWGTSLLQGTLLQRTLLKFNHEEFPGYAHRRTLGFKEGMSKADNEEIAGLARTYVFEKVTAYAK